MPATKSARPQRANDRKARTVTHACGHEQRHEDCSATWAETLAERDCTDCWRRGKDAEREQEQDARGWAKLDGSDKAVSWAMRIRDGLIEDNPDLADDHPLQAALTDVTSASWWIDYRDDLLNVDEAQVQEGCE